MNDERNREPHPNGGGRPDLGGRIRIVLERSGGIVGRPVRRGLDTAELPDEQAAQLRSLASSLTDQTTSGQRAAPAGVAATDTTRPGSRCTGGGPQSADRFVYVIEMETRGHRVVRMFSEPVPDVVRPLFALLSRAPRLPASDAQRPASG